MSLPQSWVWKHCPCFKEHPCPGRSAECKSTCDAWKQYQEEAARENARLNRSTIVENYQMEDAVRRGVSDYKSKNQKEEGSAMFGKKKIKALEEEVSRLRTLNTALEAELKTAYRCMADAEEVLRRGGYPPRREGAQK